MYAVLEEGMSGGRGDGWRDKDDKRDKTGGEKRGGIFKFSQKSDCKGNYFLQLNSKLNLKLFLSLKL